jgi:hypothetical protein
MKEWVRIFFSLLIFLLSLLSFYTAVIGISILVKEINSLFS